MTSFRHIGVIDIGKTNAKVALVDLPSRSERAVLSRPNVILPGPPYPHHDTDALWQFILDGLGALHREHGIDAVSVTTHGASAVLVAPDGGLAAPHLDYEHSGPDAVASAYDALRPPFSETGSPRLALGLNVGAQLHWLFARDPGLAARTRWVLTLPQYWSFRLTGVPATDVTSLGCHTDLWNPTARSVSTLVARLGIGDILAPAHHPFDVLGPILPGIAALTGLRPDTPVTCGIHDSNASLLPHLLARRPPFSVVSTGTWVITLSVGGKPVQLDPARDTLLNVNAFGDPVASARFMGGREYDIVTAGRTARATAADCEAVLTKTAMLLPAVEPRSGPFQHRQARWVPDEAGLSGGERDAVLAYYLALMTAECLDATGAAGPIIVEGPFARNAPYLAMLASATGRPVTISQSATGTSIGAALLYEMTGDMPAPTMPDERPAALPVDAMSAYAAAWRRHAE